MQLSSMSDGSRATTLLLLATAAASCGVTALAAHLLQTARLRRRQQQEDQQRQQQLLLGCAGCCSQLHGGAGRRRPDPYDTRPRTNFLTWDDYFMAVAFLSAERSKDPNKQVGACIVNTDNIILSIGYNGFPRGCSDTHLPWSKRGQSILDTKYPYVVHAEANALLNKNQAVIAGARIYVTLFPCNECAKLLIQAGIKEVVFHEAKLEPTGRRPATMEQAAAEDAAADLAVTAGREQQQQQQQQLQQQHASLCSISSTTDQRFAVGPVADLNASYVASQRLLTMAGVKLRQHQLQRAICVGHNSASVGSSDGRVSW